MALTIAVMTAEIRQNNIAKGWRDAAGGPGGNTLGDYIALLHTETAEAVEAYRDWKLADATDTERFNAAGLPKPEGVGSELGDLVIRLIDTGDVFGFSVFEPDLELADVADIDPSTSDPDLPKLITFADHMAWLDRRIDRVWTDTAAAPALALRAVVTVARKYGVDLTWEYTRKMAYNRTRSFRHGGRALSEVNA